jgi:hypothetical protein
MVDSVLSKIPLTGDGSENETVLRFAFSLHQNDRATFDKHLDKITRTCVSVIAEDRIADLIEAKFKREVAAFIKEVLVSAAGGLLG